MADKRISQLVDRGTVANNDVVPIVVSGAVTTNKATISSIQTYMQGNLDFGVTSVGITLGSSGTDVNVTGSPITTSGNITINIPTASATNRGLLSAADWITFNAKQPAGNYVTLDTTQTITAQKTFTTSGSSDTMIISHGSGSGFALDVIKAGNNEAIRVTKTSGSGNAMSITGGNFSAEAATFSGVVTTTPDAVINSLNVGRGGGNLTSNTRLGVNSLNANTTGNQNTAVGTQVLLNNTTASFNTGIGYNALLRTTTGSGNTAVGAQALVENTTGPQNTAVGVFALQLNTTASANTAIGWSSLYSNTTGTNNTGLGSQSLHQNTTGINNTAAGRIALRDNTTGSQNSAFGNLALYFNTTGSQNTGIGYSALGGITTGINNVAVGHIAGNLINSGTDNATSNNSVYIGQDTRASASGNTNEIVIGSAGRGNGSNTVTIGNSSITDNYFTGNIRGGAFIRTGGTSSEFLKADGSVDSNTYLTTGSASSTYLPLTGGTLTGALNGTSAVFTGNVTSYDTLVSRTLTNTTPNLLLSRNNANNGFGVMRVLDGGTISFENGATGATQTSRLTLDGTTGAAIFTGALNGTSASFTGDITASSNAFFGTFNGNDKYHFEPFTNAAGGANNAYFVSGKIDNNERSGFVFQARNSNGDEYNALIVEGYNSTSTTPALTLASTGAATFSSSVTAGDGYFATGVNGDNSSISVNHSTDYTTLRSALSGTRSWQLDNVGGNFRVYMQGTSNSYVFNVTPAGNVGICTPSPSSRLSLGNQVAEQKFLMYDNNDNFKYGLGIQADEFRQFYPSNGSLTFGTISTSDGSTFTERMRITSGGYLKASNTGSYNSSTGTFHEFNTNQNDTNVIIRNTSSTLSGARAGIEVSYSSASPNSTTAAFYQANDTSGLRFEVRSNGGIANYSGNNVSLSDERTKKDIEPLESYWDKFKEIEIVKFKYKDQTHDDFNIGVIAQQVESVAPEFVDVDGWDTKPELDEEGNEIVSEEEPLKSIYTADLYHATIKVLQEAMTKIEELQIQIDSLKNQIK